jgi:hypothetical protein
MSAIMAKFERFAKSRDKRIEGAAFSRTLAPRLRTRRRSYLCLLGSLDTEAALLMSNADSLSLSLGNLARFWLVVVGFRFIGGHFMGERKIWGVGPL